MKNSWKRALIICSIITIITVKFTTPFSTFVLVLAIILVVVPLILLFTSGIFRDIIFYIKRFERLPDDNRPTSPGMDAKYLQATAVHEEMVRGRKLELYRIKEDRDSAKPSSESLIRLSPDYKSMSVIDFFVKNVRSDKTEVSKENQEIIKSQIVEEMLNIENLIDKIDGQNMSVFPYEKGVGYSFVFSDQSEYSFIQGMILKLEQSRNISIEAILKKYQPFSLALQTFEKNVTKADYTDFPDLSENFSIDYSHPNIFKKILYEDKIAKSLNSIHKSISSFFIDKKYFTANEIKIENVIDVLNVLQTMYHRLISEDAGIVDVENIRCYECEHQLDRDHKTCPNCGDVRPQCIVCLLDLYPSETEEIVKTSCCGIYAHKYHLLMWLDKKDRCPNCKTKKPNWVKFLK